jgi:hypothetical protein
VNKQEDLYTESVHLYIHMTAHLWTISGSFKIRIAITNFNEVYNIRSGTQLDVGM